MKWKYESNNAVEHLSLHDCECNQIYSENNNLVMLMEWMEILETHPDNPYTEAHQSGNGRIELLGCQFIYGKHNVGDKKILIKSIEEISFQELEVLDFDIEIMEGAFRAKIYMLKENPQKEFEDLSMELIFHNSKTMFNQLNDVSWFVDFDSAENKRERKTTIGK